MGEHAGWDGKTRGDGESPRPGGDCMVVDWRRWVGGPSSVVRMQARLNLSAVVRTNRIAAWTVVAGRTDRHWYW